MRKPELFDFIPEDVHERVATYVRSSSYYNALRFAQQSTSQRLAMAEALDFKLYLNDAFKEDVEAWITIFGDSVRTLDSSRLTTRDLPETFVDLPNLSSAEIYGYTSHFRSVKRSPRLKHLRVVIHRSVDWNELVETLASLPLKELCLECDWETPCRLRRLCGRDMYRLSNACPRVKKLDMNCSCENTCSPWPLLSSFKRLTHLSLHRMVREEATTFLASLTEVELHGNMPIRKILPIGSGVTAVTQLRRACKETVDLLANFPRLRVLRLAMLNGAEKAVPGVVEKVEVLDLSWGYDDFYDDSDDIGYGDGVVNADQGVNGYYEVGAELIEEILHSARHLRELSFRKAVVHVEVVEKIIESVGKRLEKLSIHMDQQGEAPAVRLYRILRAASRFCPNVKRIELLGPLVEKEATLRQKQRCYKALEALKLTSPLVATSKLRQYINGIEEIPEVGG